MQDYPQAVAAWREAVALAPGNTDIHRGLALALIAQDKPQAAIGDLGVALAKSPDDPRLYNALGIAHDMMGRHDLAQQDYQRGLKIAPDNLGLRNNYGLSLVLSGKYADAIVALVQAAGAPNASARNRLNLALAYGLAGDDAKAAATARPVLDEKAVQSNLASYAMLRAMDPKQRTDAILGAELHGLPLSSAIAKSTPDAKMAAIPSPHVETAALPTPAAAPQPSAAPVVAVKPAAPVAPASPPAEHAPEFAKATPAPVKPAAADVLPASTPTAPAVEPSELAKATPAPVQPAAAVVPPASTPATTAVDHPELAKATPAPVQSTAAPVAPAAPTPLVFGPDGSPSAAPSAAVAAVSPAPPPVPAAAPVAPTEVAAATPPAAPVTAVSPAPAPKAAPVDHASAAQTPSEHAARVRLAGAPGEHYVVQLGSFSVEALAQKLVDRFAAKGITLTMSRNVDREHRVWFVVRTAEVASSDEAQSALQQIKTVGGITPAIVRVSAMREPAAAAHAADIAPTADRPTSVAAQHAD